MINREGGQVVLHTVPGIQVIRGSMAGVPDEHQTFGTNQVTLIWDQAFPYVSLGELDNATPVTEIPVGARCYVHAKFRTVFHNPGLLNEQLGWAVAFSIWASATINDFTTQSTYWNPLQGTESYIDSYFKPSFIMPNVPTLDVILKNYFGDKHTIYINETPPQPWT